MELALFQADENGFVNLGGIVQPGTHFTVARNAAGIVKLTPVKVTTTATVEQPTRQEDPGDEPPFQQ